MAWGISLYPEHSTVEQDCAYIERAARHGFSRIFSCLLSVEGDPAQIKREFAQVCSCAHANGMEIILDVAPRVFDALGISYDDLSFFSEVGADGIRLDEPFQPSEIATMTRNPYGIKIELNASSADGVFAATLAHDPRTANLLACHNFYPQRYSALSTEFFKRESRSIKQLGLRLAAFVGLPRADAFGPWPLNEGLPTLECHRDAPIDFQARHLLAMGCIDDIIISNCFATDEELASLAALDASKVQLRPLPDAGLTQNERTVATWDSNQVRGDLSPYILRSTMNRVVFSDLDIPARNPGRDLVRGDVVVVNNESPRYKGELQLVLADLPSDGTRNVVGTLPAHELELLGYLDSWKRFDILL
ncbi:MAG: MupG family TIM beta-alpha barrel fold protein [Coriobacteriaceae bacterium]|nr:MupG family TIM beta-alpha barrel fold protein [Coriobacteriaceae bacterium]